MFPFGFSSLPLHPPPFPSILPSQDASGSVRGHDHFPNTQASQRRVNSHQPHPWSARNRYSLQNLLQDESAIASRKMAISTYGYSWLRPAGVAKTMLGRREEEAEREELERQMREQEEMELEMERGEELARQARLREQHQHGGVVEGEEAAARNLDDDIPDADEDRGQDGSDVEGEVDADLDDEIPDADGDNGFADEDESAEGETGITDDVNNTNLGIGTHSPPQPTATTIATPGNRGPQDLDLGPARLHAAHAAHQNYMRRRDAGAAEQETLANARFDGDEQGSAGRDLDAEIPNEDEDAVEVRDLDDDVPEAEEEVGDGEWQHTDTELGDESAMMLTEDEGDMSMDVSVIGRRRSGAAAAAAAADANVLATPAVGGSSMLRTPITADTGSAGRSWLGRRSLTGRARTGNLFAGHVMGIGSASGSPQAPMQAQPGGEMSIAQEQEPVRQPPPPPRQPMPGGRRRIGRENRSARGSLD